MAPFRNRADAGRVLAGRLSHLRGQPGVVVLGLPRGGVPVAFEVARALDVPLDVFMVRKLGVPGHEELAFGAIASGGVRVLNTDVIRAVGLSEQAADAVTATEQKELERRERAFRDDRPLPEIQDRTVILIDDGLATGASMLVAARALRRLRPALIVVAVPVASRQACELLTADVDEVICAETPEPFEAVGLWYEDFLQTTDQEVRDLLNSN